MAFNYDLTPCRAHLTASRFNEVTRSPDGSGMHPVAHAIIMASIPCGFDAITHYNFHDIAKRIAVYERCFGSLVEYSPWYGEAPSRITAADVHALIGLKTNARVMSDDEFARAIGYKLVTETGTTRTVSLTNRINNHFAQIEREIKAHMEVA